MSNYNGFPVAQHLASHKEKESTSFKVSKKIKSAIFYDNSKGYLAGDCFIAEINDSSFPLDTAKKKGNT